MTTNEVDLEQVTETVTDSDTKTKKTKKKKKPKRTIPQRIVDYVLDNFTCVLSTEGVPTLIAKDDSSRAFHLPSKELDARLARDIRRSTGMVVVPANLSAAMLSVAGECLDGPRRRVMPRVALDDDVYYYNLGPGRILRIYPGEPWEIVDHSTVIFPAPSDFNELPNPVRNPDFELGRLSNYLSLTPHHLHLAIAYIFASLSPNGPYPILGVIGKHGSTKTSCARFIHALIDSRIDQSGGSEDLSALPTKVDDLFCVMNLRHCLGFDNASSIDQEISNALCLVATGGSTIKRQLYTDKHCVVLSGRRPILITSIESDIFKYGDLKSRVFQITPTVPKVLKPENKLREEFQRDLPKFLGTIFDCIAYALANHTTSPPIVGCRFVDTSQWITASEVAAGYKNRELSKSVELNFLIEHTIESLLPVVAAESTQESTRWKTSELAKRLASLGLDIDPVTLGRRLKQPIEGLAVEWHKGTRTYSIQVK